MSNYLQGIGRAVGFTDNTARGGALGEQGDAELWDAVSRMSSRGEVNNLRGARGPGPGLPPGGGARTPAGENYPIASPTHRERQQQITGGDRMIQQGGGRDQQFPNPNQRGPQGRGQGGVPRAVGNDDGLDVQSRITDGGELEQGLPEGGGARPPSRGGNDGSTSGASSTKGGNRG